MHIFDDLPPTPNPDAVAPDIALSGPDRPGDLQMAMGQAIDEYLQHDKIALSRLSPDRLQAQREARERLWGLVLGYWEQAKADRLNPATRTEWQSVAGMVDLAAALHSNVEELLHDEEE